MSGASSAPTVWLTGAGGMLGSALRAKLEGAGLRCLATDVNLDIADESAVLAFAKAERPAVIVNSAAYTRVDDAETNEGAAARVNAEGARVLGQAALEVGAKLVHFSTDYVFGGEGASEPYAEDAPTAPQGVYARTKLDGERRVLETASAGGRPYVIRTSWLFGENGPNFVKTMLGLLQTREELRVVSDQHGRPTYTHDLADAALELVGLGSRPAAAPGVYHFANSGATTWHAFTLGIRDACLSRGLPLKVQRILPVTTAEFPRPAPRPAYSVLSTARIEATLGRAPRPWSAALDDYLSNELRKDA
jgi:dTDP-4-dehydrorhamnose reductase